jgi:ABC-2 type transport system ATP-binding protein
MLLKNIISVGESMEYIIQVKNVTKNYGKGKKTVCAINNTTMNIEKGKITALLGPNGSGKSTLIKSICGLIEIDDGEIIVNNQNISKNSKVLDNIGCILEGERNIYYYLTVYDNLYYFGKLNKIKRSVLKEKINEVLDQLGLTHKKDSYVSELSRGMQQKVALAILLIKDPEILLLDEPTLGLDVQSSLQLNKYLVYLCKERGKSIILTTHQLDLAEQISDNVILFQDGKVLLSNAKKDVIKEYQTELEVRILFNKKITKSQLKLLSSYGKIENNEDYPSITTQLMHINTILILCKEIDLEVIEINSTYKNLQDVFLQVTGG